jgi:hypothetical protein
MGNLRQLERAIEGGSDQGSLNGTTSVELVATAPTGFTRVVERLSFLNVDSAQVAIRARVTVAGPTHYEFDNDLALAVNGNFHPVTSAQELRLSPGESVTGIMDSAPTTTNPTWVACWRDEPTP